MLRKFPQAWWLGRQGSWAILARELGLFLIPLYRNLGRFAPLYWDLGPCAPVAREPGPKDPLARELGPFALLAR